MAIIKGREYGLGYNVDVVLCIEGTASAATFIDDVKKNILSFYRDFSDYMDYQCVDVVRLKIILFRGSDFSEDPITESGFFNMDDEDCGALIDFLNGVELPDDVSPKYSLEAFALAMKSDWNCWGPVRRHVIIMYTNSPVKPLGEGSDKPAYPADMPKNLDELKEWWDGKYMETRSKRLLLFAPDAEPWSNINDWLSAYYTPISEEKDIWDGLDFATLRNLIAKVI